MPYNYCMKQIDILLIFHFHLSIFNSKSSEGTSVSRQAVKCEARNPWNKDYTIIRVPKVRQKISHQKHIFHHIVFHMLLKTIHILHEMTLFCDWLFWFFCRPFRTLILLGSRLQGFRTTCSITCLGTVAPSALIPYFRTTKIITN